MADAENGDGEGNAFETNKTGDVGKTGKPFRPIRAPARGKPGRGFVHDPEVICDALIDTWEEFSDALNKIPEDVKDFACLILQRADR